MWSASTEAGLCVYNGTASPLNPGPVGPNCIDHFSAIIRWARHSSCRDRGREACSGSWGCRDEEDLQGQQEMLGRFFRSTTKKLCA